MSSAVRLFLCHSALRVVDLSGVFPILCHPGSACPRLSRIARIFLYDSELIPDKETVLQLP
jgi:hypothetical protein